MPTSDVLARQKYIFKCEAEIHFQIRDKYIFKFASSTFSNLVKYVFKERSTLQSDNKSTIIPTITLCLRSEQWAGVPARQKNVYF